jgi:signal transduction histidine kinase
VYGEISIRSTGNDIPLLLGNVTSISIGAIVCILGSMLFKRTKPLITTQTPLAAEKENNYPVVANEILTKASKVAKRYALLFSAVLVLVWPLPLFVSGYVLSEFDFHLWIILAISWTLIAGSSTIILPILESREGIAKIVQNAIIPIIFTGIVIIAVVSSWYMYNYETAQRSAISQLVQERLDASDIKTTLISSIEKQGSYTFSFIWSILGIVGTFAVIVVILDSKLRRLVLFQTRELLKANEELVKKDRLKEEFVNVAAHELRTPIQPILMLSELAIKGLLEPGMAVNKILQEAKRLRQLTDDILDVSKIETGNIEYRLEVFDITELLSSIIEKMKLQLTGGVLIETRFDTRVAIITADKSRLTQVFTNIIGNAMKYTTSGFIKVETSHLALSGNLRIEVKDTGPGIPAELVPRLFEKFATKDIDNKNRQGTGLGLFICKKIVEHHSGMIEAYNNIDGGATFAVIIPTKSSLDKIQYNLSEKSRVASSSA